MKFLLTLAISLLMHSTAIAGNPVYSLTYVNQTDQRIQLKLDGENCGVMSGGWSVNLPAHSTAHRMVYRNNSHGCNGNFNAYVNQQAYAKGQNLGLVRVSAGFSSHFEFNPEVQGGKKPFIKADVQNSGGSLKITFKINRDAQWDWEKYGD